MCKEMKRYSRCGETELRASWKHWDAVLSQAWHRGLRDLHCCSCDLGHACGSNLIPGLETPYGAGRPKKPHKNKQTKKKRN